MALREAIYLSRFMMRTLTYSCLSYSTSTAEREERAASTASPVTEELVGVEGILTHGNDALNLKDII